MRRGLALLGVLLATAVLCAGPGVKLTVNPRVASAPATLTTTVRVERDERARLLLIELDGTIYVREDRTWPGLDAPLMWQPAPFRDTPCGEYEVRATVFDFHGRPLATDSVKPITLTGFACQ